MNCIALDDEPLALEVIKTFCEKIPDVKLVKTFTSTSDALDYILNFPVDLLFLDIQMPEVSGVNFHKKIPEHIMVIYTTAYSEYAVEGFNLNATDYLLKPFSFDRFQKAVQKAKDYYLFTHQQTGDEAKFIFVRSDYTLVKINLSDVLYIETLDDYLKIHLPGRKPVLTLMSMKTLQEKLPEKDFIRVHRSYLVPMSRVESVRGKTINLGITEIPIGKSYEEAFFKAYTRQGFL